MSEEDFVNRRGHSISAVQVAADSLPEPEHHHPAERPKPTRRKRQRIHLSGKALQAIAVAVLVIILTPILIGEFVRQTYANEVASAKKDISTLFADIVSQQKTTATSKTLASADAKIQSIGDRLCVGGLFDNIAKLYPRSKQAYEDCNAYHSKVTALETSVKEAAAQMAYLEQLQPVLSGVTQPLADQFAVFSAQQENWQALVSSLQQLSVPTSLETAHNGLVTQATAIRDQWIAMVQAANVYDSAKYTDAKTKLDAAYQAFQKQADTFTSAIQQNQTAITQEVQALR